MTVRDRDRRTDDRTGPYGPSPECCSSGSRIGRRLESLTKTAGPGPWPEVLVRACGQPNSARRDRCRTGSCSAVDTASRAMTSVTCQPGRSSRLPKSGANCQAWAWARCRSIGNAAAVGQSRFERHLQPGRAPGAQDALQLVDAHLQFGDVLQDMAAEHPVDGAVGQRGVAQVGREIRREARIAGVDIAAEAADQSLVFEQEAQGWRKREADHHVRGVAPGAQFGAHPQHEQPLPVEGPADRDRCNGG